ncbi:AAA family ATPase [Kamptonema cortianum]|nr:AAA family ATPase [Geitlerinema splendidum]MDK3157100.1 AAA family ATPase [Kamptonema cortianum]
MVRVHVTPPEDSSDATEVAWAHRLGRKLQEEFKPFEDGDVFVHAKASAYGYGQKYNDIDVVIIGFFPNGIDRQIDCMVRVKDGDPRKAGTGEAIRFYSICMTIEIKSHDARSVRVVGLNELQVQYESGWKSATDQSEGQKEALKAILLDRLGVRVWVTNAIWLTSFDRSALPKGVLNLMPKVVALNDLLQVCCNQSAPYQSTPGHRPFYSALSLEGQDQLDASKLSSFLSSLKRVEVQDLGNMSRKKLEQVMSTLINDQQYTRAIGKQLVIIRGKPGTGKTIKLLRLAHDLAARDGARIRILTYNLALVSDIRRLIALTGINEETAGVVEISSLDKFFYELITICGLGEFDYDRYFDQKDRMLADIQEGFKVGLITEDDIVRWLESPQFRFDFIFVDEGQDWHHAEQALLIKLFGPSRVVVGDGIEQMVRTQSRSEWSERAESGLVHRVPPERRCLRQKYNLNEFNRALASAVGLTWDLESRPDFPGGRVILATTGYTQELHEQLWKECQQDGNKGYEMLFMVPPSLASGMKGPGFPRRAEFEAWGARFWDGTVRDNRKEFPTDPLEHRVVQYESCRGLEAWTSICLGLDEIFGLKLQTWERPPEDQMSMEADEDRRVSDAYRWCMMPLTRAIDTTVITLTDANSEFSKLILAVGRTMPDVVQLL